MLTDKLIDYLQEHMNKYGVADVCVNVSNEPISTSDKLPFSAISKDNLVFVMVDRNVDTSKK